MGDEVGHLEQAVGVGAAEGWASDDVLYGDVPGALAVLPDLVPAGDGVATHEPAVEAGHHLLAALVEDEEGVAVRGSDGGVDAVEQPVEAGPLVAPDVGLAQADVDDLDATDGPGGVFDDAQPAGEDFGPPRWIAVDDTGDRRILTGGPTRSRRWYHLPSTSAPLVHPGWASSDPDGVAGFVA